MWSDVLDDACREAAGEVDVPGAWSLVALGSYARRELCPGSDVDVMLLHDGGARGPVGAKAAETLWYPLWDAGLVLGHAVRTPKEAVALAGEELDALTCFLEPRLVHGDPDLAVDLAARVRRLAEKRRAPMIESLARAAATRHERPGPIAEMLEPNLKEGAGGLRDAQALEWVGWALGEPGALDALVAGGFLHPDDPQVLSAARHRLLDVRVALHRAAGTRSDVLTLQEQETVACALDAEEADSLVRGLAESARAVTWIATDVWRRLVDARRGPSGRVARRDRVIDDGIVARDGCVTLTADARLDASVALRTAAEAARLGMPIARSSLERLRDLDAPVWTATARESFVSLLRSGRAAIPVIEALDQVGLLVGLVPEWSYVRAQPQRNAYHRFTVDRHLIEAVAECAAILDDPGFDGDVARRTRPELLLLGALCHDLGKGLGSGDDHSEAGAHAARAVTGRMGLDAHGIDVIEWLVRHHLLLADTATRRDLADEATIVRFGRAVRDTERLDLLYALTVGDSRATGPAAWSTAKAALVRQLFVETDALLERGVVGADLTAGRSVALESHRDLLDRRELAVAWTDRPDGLVECTVVAPDRTGLLATVSGVLALYGFDIQGATAYGDDSGMALESYRGIDVFGRLDDGGRLAAANDVAAALEGRLPLRARLEERIRRYRRPRPAPDTGVQVRFDLEASSAATVVEIDAPDEIGLLSRIAAVFADLDLDVSAAMVSTLGERVVDVFYLRDAQGAKLTAPLALDRLRATLVARLAADSLIN